VKLEANMEAVILRQSVQLQTNVVTKPGLPGRGYEASILVNSAALKGGEIAGGGLTNAS
jgi:hypothetical protein